jgi:hypothetical protein
VSLSCAVGRVALVLGGEQSLAFAAMAGQAVTVDRSAGVAAGPRMAHTVPKASSACSAFQADLDQLVASVL